MEARFLSRFTPSLMPPDALEAIFVQREELLQSVLDRIRTSALSSEKQNTLLIGPRGIGKTHFVSLAYYRLRRMNDLQDRILIAWLREEEWGIACFRDFLLRILRSLVPAEQGEVPQQRLNALYSLQMKDAEAAALSQIRELAGDRALVLLVENLDELLQKLGSAGEVQLFQFVGRFGCLLATSPGPVSRVLPPGSPFRQTFSQVQQLKELSFEDAVELIRRIALYQDNKELLELIDTPRGRARVRALRYLAGGNHRAYVVFAPLLTLDSIGRMIEPFMRIVDDLTPYYNSKIAALSMQQRQAMEHICESRRPVRTAEVAQACFMTQSAASAQLEAVTALGHLNSIRVGNERYYELREPLMRLSFEVKKHRGKPIALLLDFLRLWYSPAELRQKLSAFSAQNRDEQHYIPALQALQEDWEDPRISECCRDYTAALNHSEYEHALAAAEELSTIRGMNQDFLAQASCLIRLDRFDKALSVYDRLLELEQADSSVWQAKAWILTRTGRYEEALSCCRKAIELDPAPVQALCHEASILLSLGRAREALQSCEEAIRINDKDILPWNTIGSVLAELNLFEEALTAFSRVVTLAPDDTKARVHLCAALVELHLWPDALQQAEAAIEISPEEPEPWVLKGSALSGMGKHQDSLIAFNRAMELGEESSYVAFKRAELLLVLEHWREAAADLDRALGKFANSDAPAAGDSGALIRCLLPGVRAPEILQLTITVLLLVYRKHGMADFLAQGLVEIIPGLVSSTDLSDADAILWRDAWQRATRGLSEFQLPIRFLDSAVRYRCTRDTVEFAHLSPQERAMLETLLGIQAEAIA